MSAEVVPVYRLEIEIAGRWVGPFNAHIYDDSLTRVVHRFKDALPWSLVKEPKDDGIGSLSSDMVIGFVNGGGFLIWCDCRFEVNDLLDAGFKLHQFNIPKSKLRIGGTQVAFRRAEFEPVASYTWMGLYEKLTADL